jgi:hypothetical protein
VALGDVVLESGRGAAQGESLVEGDEALLAQGQLDARLPHSTSKHIGTDKKAQV